jgi:ABC-type phosphate transport system auxiliary subunit
MSIGLNLTPKQADGLVKATKKLNKADAINMAVQVVGEVGVKFINTLYEVKNEKKKQQIISDLDKLNNEQISELVSNLDKITDSNARIEELSSSISKFVAQKVGQDISGNINKQNLGKVMSDRKKIYIAIGVTLAIFLTIIVVKKITK